MQHGHALHSTLNVELVVALTWLNLGFIPGLSNGLGLSRRWSRYKSAKMAYFCVELDVKP